MEFITDRTQEDVDRIKEVTKRLLQRDYESYNEWSELLSEYLENSKGALNYSDLHRIASNMNEIAGLIHPTGYVQMYVYSDDYFDRDGQSIPRASFFKTMYNDLLAIRGSRYYMADTPTVPQRPFNAYNKINDIEKILEDAYLVYRTNTDGLFRCGDSSQTFSASEIFADENGEYMLL